MRRGLLLFLVGWLALAALPFVREAIDFPVFYLVFLSAVWFWTAEATSWNLLSGYSGYFSFGQAAFVGVGAYATAVLVGRHDWPFVVTLPVAAGLSTLLALGIGAVAFRLRSLRGEIFALLTLAVPFILASLARITPAIDGGQGIVVPTPDVPDVLGGFQEMLYLLALTIAMAALAIAWAVARTRTGWALFAIHDAEDVAEGLGVPTFRAKMVAIGLSGLLGGLGGSVYALQIGFVTVESVFGLTIPLFVIVMAVLGGRAWWAGPLIGAVVVVTLQDRLAASGFEGWSLVILGSILAILIVLAPEGLAARAARRPIATALALVVPTATLGVLGMADGLVDWLAVGLGVAAVVALVPLPRRSFRPGGRRPESERAAAEPSAGSAGRPAAIDAVLSTGSPPESAAAATDARPIVEVLDVARHYGGVRALDGVSLEVREGEILGLVGPNGSGKSTLIGLIAGTIRPTSGQVRIDGRPTAGLPAHRIAHLGIARTYQIPRPFESMTVRDNVALAIQFGRTPTGLDEARSRASAALTTVGLERRADARPAEINLHERQLLEMARAIAARPRVLLLDEALAGLNPAEIDDAVAVVRRIQEGGVTIVIVEHLLRVVNQLATRIVVLEQGRLLASGAPTTVMQDPAVVRAYLGSSAGA